jgi:hypothetical protein
MSASLRSPRRLGTIRREADRRRDVSTPPSARDRRADMPKFRVLVEASNLLMTEEDGSVSSGGFFQTLWVDAPEEGAARRRAVAHVVNELRERPGFIRNPADALVEIDVTTDEMDDLDASGRIFYPLPG